MSSNVIAKNLYSGPQPKGRKPKPSKAGVLSKLFEQHQKSKDIATLGVFRKIPREIAEKIHDKDKVKEVTSKEYSVIAQVIIESQEDNGCLVHLTDNGKAILENIIEINRGSEKLKIRIIFGVQERQLVLG